MQLEGVKVMYSSYINTKQLHKGLKLQHQLSIRFDSWNYGMAYDKKNKNKNDPLFESTPCTLLGLVESYEF